MRHLMSCGERGCVGASRWREAKLGDLVELNKKSIGKNFPHAEIDYVDISSVGSGVLHGTTRYKLINAPGRARRLVSHGDTILATVRPNRRSFLYIEDPGDNLVVSTGFAALTPKEEIDSRFLYYLVADPKMTDYLANNAKGSAYPAVDADIIENAPVNVPSLDTQCKIASILSAFDDLIENNNRRIRILEEMALLIYKEWFINFRFPGHEDVKMVDSELGSIPKGWGLCKLSAVVEPQYGYTESASEAAVGPKYVRGTDINKTSYIQWDTVPYCVINSTDYAKYKLRVGDVLVIRMADPGKVGIIERDVDAVFASYLIRLNIMSGDIAPYYLFYFLLSDRYQNYVTGASTGTTRKSASAGVITDIDMIVPPAKVVGQFETRVLAFRQMLNSLLHQNEILRQTRDLLLPKLISGEIDVEKLEIAV